MGRTKGSVNENVDDEVDAEIHQSSKAKDKRLKGLCVKLNAIKFKAAQIEKFVQKYENISDIPRLEIEVRLSVLKETEQRWSELNDNLAQIQGDDFFSEFVEECERFSEDWYSLYGQLQNSVKKECVVDSRQVNSGISIPFMPKLPEPRLPEFDGSKGKWLEFRETFKTLIHENPQIPEILKLTYLLGKLKGRARDTVGFVSYTQDGYLRAWKGLCETYDDKRANIDAHINGILGLPRISKDTFQELTDLVNSCNSHIASLSAIEYPLDKLSEMLLINILLNKLNVRLKMEWEKEVTNNDVPTWEQFLNFLKRQCRILERSFTEVRQTSNASNQRSADQKSPASYKFRSVNNNTNTTFLSNCANDKGSNNLSNQGKLSKVGSGQPENCPLCNNQSHWLYMCPKFLQLDTFKRFEKVKEQGCCINCLKTKTHRAKECLGRSCKTCNKKHHTLLHHLNYSPPNGTIGQSSKENSTPRAENLNEESQSFHTSANTTTKRVILSTAIILVRDKNGKYHECRALLDNASTSNYITDEFTSRLRLKRQAHPSSTRGINNTRTIISEKTFTHVRSKSSSFERELECSIVPSIAGALPQSDFNISLWNIPGNLILADPLFNFSRPIDMLIGGEVFFDLFRSGRIVLGKDQPRFQQSVFGWVCVGSVIEDTQLNFCLIEEPKKSESDELHQSLKRLFDVDNVPERKILSDEERFCENHLVETTSRDKDGRYIVSLPLKEDVDKLGESKHQAVKQFERLECRFKQDESFGYRYSEVMKDYFIQGHMIQVDEAVDVPGYSFYLPHHAVMKPSSSTTKIRVVFNASAKSTTGVSLNDVMYNGPTVQQTCFEITLRFRTYGFVFTSDVNKMYRQVKVESQQTPLQRIVWRENDTEPLRTFELTTVTFGTGPAPYLATRTLNQLATDEGSRFPKARRVVERDFYVDDVLSGSNDLSEAIDIMRQLRSLLESGGFKLHKWSANDERLLEDIPREDREVLRPDHSSGDECLKTLGLIWLPRIDVFKFEAPLLEKHDNFTKRKILSNISKLYDPLGLLAPAIIKGKIFVQSLWKSQLDWDDPLPIEVRNQWELYQSELTQLESIEIDRRITIDNPKCVQLHGFADASEKGYGACLYVRSIDQNSCSTVRLICSKTRVAPIKVLSLPRLELCAALLLSRLTKSVILALGIDFDEVYLWSDSTVTLTWIQTPPHKWKTFVANRVSEIQENSINFAWNHVVTSQNAADVITRGIMVSDLADLDIWWNGPDFLRSGQRYFEETNTKYSFEDLSDDIFERKPESIALFTDNRATEFGDFDLIEKFSSYDKLLRVTAYCLRFVKNSRIDSKVRNNGELSIDELHKALIAIVKVEQGRFFSKEIKELKTKGQIPRNSSVLSLNPFIGKDGVLRVGGRLKNSDCDYDSKHQILLASTSHFTELVLRNYHQHHLHAPPQLLVSLVRQRFWPISAKNTARKCVRNCVTCFKVRPKMTHQLMGDLPTERTSPSRPFTNTGVDLCGPFSIKNKRQRNSSRQKVYVAAFVCFATKGVHIEIVSDLTTDCFIACLKRFIYRRGIPYQIWSDNATNFVGAKNELNRWYSLLNDQNEIHKIHEFCSIHEIHWKFIPPRAPNFGGLWEGVVKSLKHHLRRVASNVVMSYEELATLIVQVEGILNSRPLTPLSVDPNDPSPLTPGHFLTGGPIVALPEPSVINIPDNRLSNWQKISQMTQHFWKRFSIEYLHSLQQRTKWKTSEPNLCPNDVVLVVEDNLPPTKWLMVVVLETVKGQDNKVRVALIKTKSGKTKRAISKIVRLPIDR